MNAYPDPFPEMWQAATDILSNDRTIFAYDLLEKAYVPDSANYEVHILQNLLDDGNIKATFTFDTEGQRNDKRIYYPLACWLKTLPKNLVTHLVGIRSNGLLRLLPAQKGSTYDDHYTG